MHAAWEQAGSPCSLSAPATGAEMARRTAGEGVKGIVFLAFDEAGFMTGSSLVIDGGFTAQ